MDAVSVAINHHDPAVGCDGYIGRETDLPTIITLCSKPTDMRAGFAEDLDAVSVVVVPVRVGSCHHDAPVRGDGDC